MVVRVPRKHRRWIAVSVALGAAILAGIVFFYAFVLLGVATGALGICPQAPDWWIRSYLILLPVGIRFSSGLAGAGAFRWYRSSSKPLDDSHELAASSVPPA